MFFVKKQEFFVKKQEFFVKKQEHTPHVTTIQANRPTELVTLCACTHSQPDKLLVADYSFHLVDHQFGRGKSFRL